MERQEGERDRERATEFNNSNQVPILTPHLQIYSSSSIFLCNGHLLTFLVHLHLWASIPCPQCCSGRTNGMAVHNCIKNSIYSQLATRNHRGYNSQYVGEIVVVEGPLLFPHPHPSIHPSVHSPSVAVENSFLLSIQFMPCKGSRSADPVGGTWVMSVTV